MNKHLPLSGIRTRA